MSSWRPWWSIALPEVWMVDDSATSEGQAQEMVSLYYEQTMQCHLCWTITSITSSNTIGNCNFSNSVLPLSNLSKINQSAYGKIHTISKMHVGRMVTSL
jgi:hypothetical protein